MSRGQRIGVLPHLRYPQVILPLIHDLEECPNGDDGHRGHRERDGEPLRPGEGCVHHTESDQILWRGDRGSLATDVGREGDREDEATSEYRPRGQFVGDRLGRRR